MPFWRRKPKEVDPQLEAARAEAEASLPPGWQIYRSDRERFSVPQGRVTTYAISAVGPTDERALVIAVGEPNAYRQLARLMRGELEPSEAWSVPLDDFEVTKSYGHFDLIKDEDPNVIAAKRELDASVPSGWELYDTDREDYRFPSGSVDTCAASAVSVSGDVHLVMGLGEAGAFLHLARALRGELEITEAWAVPVEQVR